MNKKIDLILILMLVITICFPTAYGDGGIISPPQIYIQERAQNAIVAWNGTEEVLILSIDIDSSESTRVLRIIPLPSNPTEVKEGSFDSFTTLQNIINKKLQDIYNFSHLGKENGDYGAGGAQSNIVEITFQETIGAHNVTIFKILDSTNFTDYATDFAHSMGLTDITFSSSFQITVDDYLQDNISYFVFDIIDATEEEHSINPIIYRFKTDYLYYPLKITAASDVGETYANVNVFCIAKNRIKEEIFTDLSFYSNIDFYWYYGDFLRDINLTEDELLEISQEIYDLFKDDPFVMSYEYSGYYEDLEDDIIASEEDFASPDFNIIVSDTVFVERGASTVVNVTIKNTGNTEIRINSLNIEGGIEWLQHSWYSITPSYYWDTLEVGDEVTFEVLFQIPSNIPLGDYQLNYSIYSSNYGIEKQKSITMTVYEKTEGGIGLYQSVEDIKTGLTNLLAVAIIFIILMTVFLVVFIYALFKK